MNLDQEPPSDKAGPGYSCPRGVLESAAQPLLPLQGGLETTSLQLWLSSVCGSRKFDIQASSSQLLVRQELLVKF